MEKNNLSLKTCSPRTSPLSAPINSGMLYPTNFDSDNLTNTLSNPVNSKAKAIQIKIRKSTLMLPK